MNTPPKVIYLQWYDESEGKPFDPDRSEVTWCVDRIYDTDLVYVLQDTVIEITEENISIMSLLMKAARKAQAEDETLSKERCHVDFGSDQLGTCPSGECVSGDLMPGCSVR